MLRKATRYSPSPRRSKIIVKFAGYNVQYGVGLDGRYDLDRIADAVRDADIIALQEVTRNFARNGYDDMVAGLEARLPRHFSAFHAPVDILLNMEERDGRLIQHRLQFGNMIFSRLPILSVRGLMLPRSRTYERLNLQRSALEAIILAPSGPIRVYSIHLDHVSPEERLLQIACLKRWLTDVPGEGVAVTGAAEMGMADTPAPEDYVVLGDFNLQPETPEYESLFGAKDPFYGRVPRRTLPVDAHAFLGQRPSGSYSWEGPAGETERLWLDYALVSASLAGRLKTAFVDNSVRGSDHFPLFMELA